MWFLGFLIFLVCVGTALYPLFTSLMTMTTEQARKFEYVPHIHRGIIGFIVGVLIWYGCASVVIVQAGDRASVFSVFTGVKNTVLGEGFHIVPKIINSVSHYDVYTKTWTEYIACLSSDGLAMNMDINQFLECME